MRLLAPPAAVKGSANSRRLKPPDNLDALAGMALDQIHQQRREPVAFSLHMSEELKDLGLGVGHDGGPWASASLRRRVAKANSCEIPSGWLSVPAV